MALNMATVRSAFTAGYLLVMSKCHGKEMRGNNVVKRGDGDIVQSPNLTLPSPPRLAC